jgi:hypothetical protein
LRRYSIKDGQGTDLFLVHVIWAREGKGYIKEKEPIISSLSPDLIKLPVVEPNLPSIMDKLMVLYSSQILPCTFSNSYGKEEEENPYFSKNP